jgi:hypothetical protein
MASRHGSNELFATYQNVVINGSNLYDINYKRIIPISSASSFKIKNTFLNPNKKLVKVKCYDMDGKLLFNKIVNDQESVQYSISEFQFNKIIIIKFEYDDESILTNKYLLNNSNTLIIKQ